MGPRVDGSHLHKICEGQRFQREKKKRLRHLLFLSALSPSTCPWPAAGPVRLRRFASSGERVEGIVHQSTAVCFAAHIFISQVA